jgi:hypothetical protein
VAGHGHVTPNADGTRAKGGGPGLCGQCSTELIQRQHQQQVLPLDSFVQARQRMCQAFRDDPGLLLAYHANIAMLVHDRHGVTTKPARDKLASDVLALIFGLTETEATP